MKTGTSACKEWAEAKKSTKETENIQEMEGKPEKRAAPEAEKGERFQKMVIVKVSSVARVCVWVNCSLIQANSRRKRPSWKKVYLGCDV